MIPLMSILAYLGCVLMFRVMFWLCEEMNPFSKDYYEGLTLVECWGKFFVTYIYCVLWPLAIVYCTYKYLTRKK